MLVEMRGDALTVCRHARYQRSQARPQRHANDIADQEFVTEQQAAERRSSNPHEPPRLPQLTELDELGRGHGHEPQPKWREARPYEPKPMKEKCTPHHVSHVERHERGKPR